MSTMKSLMIWVLAAFIILFILTLIFGLDREYAKLTDSTFGYIESFGNKGMCSIGMTDKPLIPDPFYVSCNKISDEDACASVKDSSQNSKCVWCRGDINTAEVGSCEPRVCGCGTFRSRSAVKITDLNEIYKRGETLVLRGNVYRAQVDLVDEPLTKKGLKVEISFLDGKRSPVAALGPAASVLTEDEEGSFTFERQIPDDAPYGRYNVGVKYADALAFEDFDIQK